MAKHEELHNFVISLSEKISNFDALLVINRKGRIMESRTSKFFDEQYDLDWLKIFAMVVSVRFPLSDFHKQLGGLKMTVNIFRNKAVIVKWLEEEDILVVIVPRTAQSIKESINMISGEEECR